MHDFLGALKGHATSAASGYGQPRFATVASFDPNRYVARVTIQPEGVLTGWLPILTGWSGAGWGMYCPLRSGDQVVLLAQEGDAEHGIIAGRAFSASLPPPNCPDGEFWLVHPSGCSFALSNDGTVRIHGDLHVAGDIYDNHGSLSHLRSTYNNHTHATLAGGRTSTPNQTD